MSETFDMRSPDVKKQIEAFVARGRASSLKLGGDAPICAVREEGHLLHVHLVAASSVKGGLKPAPPTERDGFGKESKTVVALDARSAGEAQLEGSSELAEELKAALRRFRG